MIVTLRSELIVRLADTQPEQRWFLPRRARWQVVEDFELRISYQTPDGRYITEDFVVPWGFEFDGSSIPWILWWRFQPTYPPAFRASAFHDYCYRELYRYYPKWFADDAFKAIMLNQGAPDHVAYIFHKAVSTFGKGGWAKELV